MANMFNVKTAETIKVLLGLTFPETISAHYKAYLSGERFGIHIADMQGRDATQIVIGHPSYPLMRFTVEYYPACCGIRMFHTFSVNTRVTQEQVDALLSAFFTENKYGYDEKYINRQLLGKSNRIEVIMVEHRSLPGRLQVADAELEAVDDPHIDYKVLWNFFHKFAKKVNTRLMYNSNSGNILHNMEVVLF